MDKKVYFLHLCYAAAIEAGEEFGMNARVILAQGALESGWALPSLPGSITISSG